MICLDDTGSQKIYSDSTVGMDQNGANSEPERTIKKLLYSTRKEVLSSWTMEVTVGMDRGLQLESLSDHQYIPLLFCWANIKTIKPQSICVVLYGLKNIFTERFNQSVYTTVFVD